jgi:hypothetical protein
MAMVMRLAEIEIADARNRAKQRMFVLATQWGIRLQPTGGTPLGHGLAAVRSHSRLVFSLACARDPIARCQFNNADPLR